jgi:hypothetical protein
VKTKITLVMGLMGLLALASVFAGQWTAEEIKAKIDFPFTAGMKTLPAGEYTFTAVNGDQEFRVQGMGKDGAVVNVITRLAGETYLTADEAHLVFDVVGNKYVLSEVWIPGIDGYVLQMTKGAHTHKVVKVTR